MPQGSLAAGMASFIQRLQNGTIDASAADRLLPDCGPATILTASLLSSIAMSSVSFGILGSLSVPLGLGLLRLGTEGRPSEEDAIEIIRFALDQGIRVLDTADVYSLSADDLHYGERLVRAALDRWNGPKEEVRVLTKAGLSRPKGRWVPNGRPAHLRKAVEGSLRSLGVDRLFLLQLHARDSSVPFEETLAALAELQREGKVEHLGLCNASIAELRQAERHFAIASVQNELSILTRKSATEGVVAWAAEKGIPFLAHRPLGGYAKVEKLTKNAVLKPVALRHQATPQQIALAAVRTAGAHVVPLVGATKIESLRSSIAALGLRLDVSDRTVLSAKYSFEPSQEAVESLAQQKAPQSIGGLAANEGPSDRPEVVLLMGIQGAGKSRLVSAYVAKGYVRLNRDQMGGKLEDLIPKLKSLLAAGMNRVVLDNTYPTRISRAPVIAAAHAFGVPARCRNLTTPLAEARVNIALRMLEKYGRPLGPDEMKSLAKTDPNLPPPMALGKWISSYEPPAVDEGFAVVDSIPFIRDADPLATEKGLLLDVDGTLRRTKSGEIYPRSSDDVELIPGRRERLKRYLDEGYKLFFVSNQSGIASGKVTQANVEAALLRTAELLALPIAEVAYCPHPAFPVGCYCRKPMPGLGVYLIKKHRLAREHTIMVGDMASDADFAAGLGIRYLDCNAFFA
jgi:HAD superfamily hydrolase (TIGR01662 family)